jgi:hypothetical protein
VPESCTVLIAAADLLPTLKQRTTDVNGEVLTFSDTEAIRALEVITTRRPSLVALERLFAATPRGVALINRIKADPALLQSEIRVISHDSDYSRVLPRQPIPPGTAPAGVVATPAAQAAPASAPPVAAVAVPSAPLDQRGTRRAPRFRIVPQLEVMIDGNPATLIDLSVFGAQVVSASVLKPNQRVRMALNDDQMSVRINCSVAWASFEIPPKSGPRYRAGIEFVDADRTAVDAFCVRHRGESKN